MRRLLVSILVLLLSAAALSAKPPLWKLEHKGATVYLYGTVHMLFKDTQWKTPVMLDAFNACASLWLEAGTDMDEITDFLTKHAIDMGQTLTEKMPPDLKTLYLETLDLIGYEYEFFENLKPWAAAIALGAASVDTEGATLEDGVENELHSLAGAAAKPLRYLETALETMQVFVDMNAEQEMQFLHKVLQELKQGDNSESASVAELIKTWAKGDLEALERIIMRDLRDKYPDLYTALVQVRNQSWTQTIDALLKNGSGSHFIAVGAGHLVGPDSLQALLQARGYTIVRVE